jgi:hypothetical protein
MALALSLCCLHPLLNKKNVDDEAWAGVLVKFDQDLPSLRCELRLNQFSFAASASVDWPELAPSTER